MGSACLQLFYIVCVVLVLSLVVLAFVPHRWYIDLGMKTVLVAATCAETATWLGIMESIVSLVEL